MSAPPPSKLDLRQILQAVYDEEAGTLRTDANATISNVSIAVDMDPADDGVYIADNSTGAKLVVNPDGSINVASGGGDVTVVNFPTIQTISNTGDVSVSGPPALSVVNTDLISGTVSGWYDVSQYRSASFQIIGSAGIAAGAIAFEQTNDTTLGPSGASLPVFESGLTTLNAVANNQGNTIVASSVRIWDASLTSRYIRIRISTGFTGGTVRAVCIFSEQPYASTRYNAVQLTATSLMVSASGAVAALYSLLNPEVPSSAITSSATTAAIIPSGGNSFTVVVPVTVVSGTNPTLDIAIQESDDNGTNWYTVYEFPRITATGVYRTPAIQNTGTRIRYVQTVGGTTPSFTRAINRLSVTTSAGIRRQMFDRTITLTSLSSTTGALFTEGAANLQMVINVGAITTTAPAIQLQGSDDNINWYSLGVPVTAVSSSTVQTTISNTNPRFTRAIVTTAGVGVTAGYVMIKAF